MIRPSTPVQKHTDQDLIDTWAWIDKQRVKSGANKGHVKVSAAKLGDRILTEAKGRGIIGRLSA